MRRIFTAPAAHSCCACFVAGEPGGRGICVVAWADAPPVGAGKCRSRAAGGCGRGYAARESWKCRAERGRARWLVNVADVWGAKNTLHTPADPHLKNETPHMIIIRVSSILNRIFFHIHNYRKMKVYDFQ